MRQSMAPSRASSTTHAGSSAAASLKLIEKKKEYDAVSALERASTSYLERIEALGEDCDIMAIAGKGELLTVSIYRYSFVPVHGQVLAQWPKMFQILTHFRKFHNDNILLVPPVYSRVPSVASKESFEVEAEGQPPSIAEGQRLVRVPIEELQEAKAERS